LLSKGYRDVTGPRHRIAKIASRFRRDTRGTNAIEYALIAGVVSIAIAGAVFLLGGQVAALYQQILAAFG
jgi:Flp pilus assembly pilin Flp